MVLAVCNLYRQPQKKLNRPCVMNINNSLTRKEMDNRVPRESLKEQNLALCPRRNSSPGNIMSLRANQSNQSVKKIESRYK
jgi:hypothetical protein